MTDSSIIIPHCVGPTVPRSRLAGPPIVSILLPVWNAERFLSEAIDSVLRQTFAAFELLVVDDGSTDTSAAIALAHAQRDSRIVVLQCEHAGIAHALNAGLAVARGRYIARMDADDVASPSRIEKQIAFLDAHEDCVAVGTDVEVIDEHGDAVGVVRYPTRHDDIVHAMVGGTSCSLAHPTVVMRRDAVMAAGGYRHDQFPSEDLDLWVRLSELGKFANVDEPLLRYRRHTGSVGAREALRQQTTGRAIIEAVRSKWGLSRLEPRVASRQKSAAATYHFECVRIALNSRNRLAARKHARATIRRSPAWPPPYAALAVAVLPDPAFALVMRCYERFRAFRRPSTSLMT